MISEVNLQLRLKEVLGAPSQDGNAHLRAPGVKMWVKKMVQLKYTQQTRHGGSRL